MIADIKIIRVSNNRKPAENIAANIYYGTALTPFGTILLARIQDRICHLVFYDNNEKSALDKLQSRWPTTTLKPDPQTAANLARQIFIQPPATEFRLLLMGTGFQLKIWQTLLQTNPGQTISYSQLARRAGFPQAQRAVGSAMAANPIVYLIPCHRVIRQDGSIGNYGGGTRRKRLILDWEKGNREQVEPPNQSRPGTWL